MRTEKKHSLKLKRRWRIRKKVTGTRERPRMSVHFSHQHIYVQFIDDDAGVTMASASTRGKELPDRDTLKSNVGSAERIGIVAAEAARAQGIERVVFDRNGARYHGKVKALAESARKAGLHF